MRVVLTTIGKNHSFELARQLHRHEALAAIYTGYPRFKLRQERLPAGLIRTFPWLQTPYMAYGRFGRENRWFDRELAWRANQTLDAYVSLRIPECDVFMALSDTGLKTGRKAQRRGAVYICDRGCSHIRYQDTLLREEYDRQKTPFPGIDRRMIDREEAEYATADTVTVPSTFALRSFVAMGVPAEKVACIPYGVDLSRFHPVAEPDSERFEVLYVGSASIQKGISYLLEAFACLDHPRKHLRLVGSLPQETAALLHRYAEKLPITCEGHCPQPRLKEIMSRSHVLVLPSVQDGFGMVMAEAMACGCPVIATTNTGAYDLYTDGVEGFIVPIRDSGAIAAKMQCLADAPDLRRRMAEAAPKRVAGFGGWDTYGDAVMSLFTRLLSPPD